MEGRSFTAQCYGMKDTNLSKNIHFEILKIQTVDYLTGMFSKLLTVGETSTKMIHLTNYLFFINIQNIFVIQNDVLLCGHLLCQFTGIRSYELYK